MQKDLPLWMCDGSGMTHQPVLYHEVLHAMQPRSGGFYVDGTVGAGGHAAGILEASRPDGKLLGLDLDPAALQLARERLEPFHDRVILRQGSYTEAAQHLNNLNQKAIDGFLLDLGLSSMQLDSSERGFSFRFEGPLDMRFNPDQLVTAGDLVNNLPEKDLADLIYRYGEEKQSRAIARNILSARPISTTTELAEIIRKTVGWTKSGIHPATRTFQALRIAVNQELDNLENALQTGLDILNTGGRMVVISFHSLEDRIVKTFFRRESRDCVCPPELPVCACDHQAQLKEISRRPIRPDKEEIGQNPRARSARLRAAEKI